MKTATSNEQVQGLLQANKRASDRAGEVARKMQADMLESRKQREAEKKAAESKK